MATKTELEQNRDDYTRCLQSAQTALHNGDYSGAIRHATSSCPFIDGMMQYERKYESRSFNTVETIDIILQYAPLLFDRESLDKITDLLTEKKRVEKNTTANLREQLAAAHALIWDAHRLWNRLERQPNLRQDELHIVLGGDQDQWRRVAEFWESIGVLRRTPESRSFRIAFITNMNDQSSAKCPTCGAVGKARKSKLLEQVLCPKCKSTVHFVIMIES